MAWSKIIGQERVKNILQSFIKADRIPHAICMHGIEGIGKEALALEFARTVNCLDLEVSDDGVESCGVCRSCKNFNKLQHENLSMVFPLPTPKTKPSKNESVVSRLTGPQIKEIQDEIEKKAKDPYHKIRIKDANMIKIASIREVKRDLILSSNAYGRRCVLVFDAEEMNAEAANAFLKTLEEPHENITIFLITSRPEMILPTIISRCQMIRCEPLSDSNLTKALTDKHDIDEQEAKLIAVFAQGSLLRSEDFLDEGMKELRQQVVDILRTALKKRIYRLMLMKKIEEFIKSGDKKKNETFLNLMILWLRDALLVAETGFTDGIINTDQSDIIERFADNFKERDISIAIQIVEKAISQIRKNVQMQLIYINMFLELRRIFLDKAI